MSDLVKGVKDADALSAFERECRTLYGLDARMRRASCGAHRH